MNLPPIKTAEDVNKAAEKVTQAIRRGEITPAEGDTMMNILEAGPVSSRESSGKTGSKPWKHAWLLPACSGRPEARQREERYANESAARKIRTTSQIPRRQTANPLRFTNRGHHEDEKHCA
jgi:hypothetical protein